MACTMDLFLLVFFSLGLSSSYASNTYIVGDDHGWTLGKVNYDRWACQRTFYVGDLLVFKYAKTDHDVLEVSATDYANCNSNNPIGTYTSGNDPIPILLEGDHYFICGASEHCGLGMRIKISATMQFVSSDPTSSNPGVSSPSSTGGFGTPTSLQIPPNLSPVDPFGEINPTPSENDASVAHKGLGLIVIMATLVVLVVSP